MTTVFTGISQLVTSDGPLQARVDEDWLGVIEDAAVVAGDDGRIAWLGRRAELPGSYAGATRVDLQGRAVLPGLVECHTHLVFAGDRTRDFAERCAGVSYEAIAARGGGIQTTVDATRAADTAELVRLGLARCTELLRHGVTTVEIKSGYGLSYNDELKLLEAIAAIAERTPQRVVATCLAAHVVPREHRANRAAYVAMVVDQLLPEVARRGLASFVDVFCETGAFSLAEMLAIFERARELGLGIKVHAEQLSRTGAAATAAGLGAVSADHVEFVTADDAAAMARAGTVAVLLPGAALFLGGAHRPPVSVLREAGVPMALSTDLNPGTSPTAHLPLMTTLGCAWLGLSPAEAIAGVTAQAARALALTDGTGSLRLGGPADFVVTTWPNWRRLPYEMAARGVAEVWIGGRKRLGG